MWVTPQIAVKKYGMDDRIIVENDVTNFICELAKMQFVQII